jgi:hypothetical protein
MKREIQIQNISKKPMRLVQLGNVIILPDEIIFVNVDERHYKNIQNTSTLKIVEDVEEKPKKRKKKEETDKEEVE